mmetsp:Transcript_42942/g.118765  ORF Transcript_42942/g.118765 Transcript_42942/m.118765 type:complete len:322 (-) Transcript_42942:273-1238(-)
MLAGICMVQGGRGLHCVGNAVPHVTWCLGRLSRSEDDGGHYSQVPAEAGSPQSHARERLAREAAGGREQHDARMVHPVGVGWLSTGRLGQQGLHDRQSHWAPDLPQGAGTAPQEVSEDNRDLGWQRAGRQGTLDLGLHGRGLRENHVEDPAHQPGGQRSQPHVIRRLPVPYRAHGEALHGPKPVAAQDAQHPQVGRFSKALRAQQQLGHRDHLGPENRQVPEQRSPCWPVAGGLREAAQEQGGESVEAPGPLFADGPQVALGELCGRLRRGARRHLVDELGRATLKFTAALEAPRHGLALDFARKGARELLEVWWGLEAPR